MRARCCRCAREQEVSGPIGMAGFRFNFALPDNVLTNNRGRGKTKDNPSTADTCSSSPPSTGSSARSDCCELKEVLMQPFHEQILDSVSPIRCSVILTRSSLLSSPPPSLPHSLTTHSQLCHGSTESLTLYYMTCKQLQLLLDTEHDLNLKSGTETSVQSQYCSELGPMGITNFCSL